MVREYGAHGKVLLTLLAVRALLSSEDPEDGTEAIKAMQTLRDVRIS